MKKLLSLFLAVLMVASIVAMMPVFTVSAAEASFDGDSFDPTNVIANKIKVEINADSLSSPALTNNSDNFGNSSYAKLFDGNTGSKIEGNLHGTATVTFQTKVAAIVTDYVIYTGNDNETQRGRNPASWVLKGTKNGVDWITLDEVTSTGLDEVNSTPYGYKIDNPGIYKDYRIEFTHNGYCQVCELVLYTETAPTEAESSSTIFYKDTAVADATFTLKNHGLSVGAALDILGTTSKAEVIAVDGDTVTVSATNLPQKNFSLALAWKNADTPIFITLPIDNIANTQTAIGFIQLRPSNETPLEAFDVRVIVEAYENYITSYESAKLSVTFTYGNNETKTFNFDSTSKVYASIKAGNETLTPSDDCMYFGGAVVNIPSDTYNVKATVTLVKNGEETTINLSKDGITNPYANPAENTSEATKSGKVYAIENHKKDGVENTYVIFTEYNNVFAAVNAGATVMLTINGTNYVIENFYNEGEYWGRLNAEVAGAEFLIGAYYTITMYVFDANYKMIYYTDTVNVRSGLTSSNATDTRTPVNVELPQTVTQINPKEEITDSAITGQTGMFGDGPLANLFDGTNAKMGCNNTAGAKLQITFTIKSNPTLTYYSLVTGGDTATNSTRNPLSWILYGKVDGKWVELSNIDFTSNTRPGIGATNHTPYSYKISNPTACSEYMIEFVTASDKFQMAELYLYTGN